MEPWERYARQTGRYSEKYTPLFNGKSAQENYLDYKTREREKYNQERELQRQIDEQAEKIGAEIAKKTIEAFNKMTK